MSENVTGSMAIKNARVCFDCAFPIQDPHTLICPRCQSTDIDARRSKPKKYPRRDAPQLPFPLNKIRFEHGGTATLAGNAGSGKTTIALSACPTHIETSEQENEKVGEAWYRVHPDLDSPALSMCSSWEELDEDLAGIDENSLAIIDSVSQLAEHHETSRVVNRVIQKIRERRARAIFILQFTKEGTPLGPNQLRHMVDVHMEIPDDPTGMRRLSVRKNRFGSLHTLYFDIDETGIIKPIFDQVYSVEGPPGNYRMHLYPLAGAKFAGALDLLAEAGCFLEGHASSLLPSRAYRTGFASPPDWKQRKSFAEDHGVTYLTVEDITRLLVEAKANTPSSPSSPQELSL